MARKPKPLPQPTRAEELSFTTQGLARQWLGLSEEPPTAVELMDDIGAESAYAAETGDRESMRAIAEDLAALDQILTRTRQPKRKNRKFY